MRTSGRKEELGTVTACAALASEYRKFNTRALRVTGLPVMVSCQCVAVM